MSEENPKLAVLIDADNTPAAIADGLFEEIARLGEATIRRIYGDFSGPQLRRWEDPLLVHAINPTQQFAYTKGKNASDITLVIEAMDLLHTARVDGFCLVSSDSDFTRLASRIREQGLAVYGFGAQRTPEAFVRACSRFIYIENLVAPVEAGSGDPAPDSEVEAPIRQPPSKAVPLMIRTLSQIENEDDDGWYRLSDLGSQLSKLYPDFDPRSYGAGKLSTLVEKTGAFDCRRNGRHVELRRRTGR